MPHFSGATYDHELDHARLSTALGRVYDLMKDGKWRTLRDIAEHCKTSEAGASARLRDLRKTPIQRLYNVDGVHTMRVAGGLWAYKVVVCTNPPTPTEPAPNGFLFDNTVPKPERNNNAAKL